MNSIKSKVLHVTLFAFVIVMFLMAYGSSGTTEFEKEVVRLSQGWTVKLNDEMYESVNLNEFRFPVTGKGDWIVLSCILPKNLPNDVSISINTVYCVTQMYLDGERIYAYGLEDYEDERLVGYGTTFVDLPDGSAGKELKMTMFVTENNAFSSIAVPEIYPSSKLFVTYYSERLFPLAVAATLVVAGISITLVTFCLYFKSYSMERLFCIGVFSICIGFWSLCSYNLSDIFANNLRIKTYFEFFSLYLVLFPVLLYFREDVEQRQKRFESFFYYSLVFVEILMYILVAVTQATNMVHMNNYLRFFQTFMVVAAVFIVSLIIRECISERSHISLSIAFLVLAVITLRDLASFNFLKYFSKTGTENEYKSYIAAGALVLVVAMLVDFITEMRKQMYRSAETEFLEKIAYVDVLTNLYTRRKCEELFDQIDARGYEYMIIQLDLNNLKGTNDTYGHEEGDELIRRFANCLKGTFDSGEVLGRMGGDEFIVMILDAASYDVDVKIKFLKALMEADNAQHELVKVSASIGYCRSSEITKPTAKAVYKEADARMYKDKEEYYKRIGYRRRRSDS